MLVNGRPKEIVRQNVFLKQRRTAHHTAHGTHPMWKRISISVRQGGALWGKRINHGARARSRNYKKLQRARSVCTATLSLQFHTVPSRTWSSSVMSLICLLNAHSLHSGITPVWLRSRQLFLFRREALKGKKVSLNALVSVSISTYVTGIIEMRISWRSQRTD